MNSRSTRVCPRHSLRLSAAFALSCSVGIACSSDFSISYLFSTEAQLLAAPEGSFADEIARLARVNPPPHQASRPQLDSSGYREQDPRSTTAQIDIADVRAALALHGLPPDRVEEIGDQYAAARMKLEAWLSQREVRMQRLMNEDYPQWNSLRITGAIDYTKDEPMPPLALPAELPAEFARYFAGAIAWHQGKFVEARAAWTSLLALPEAERPFRSTWAAFMLARSYAEESGRAFGPERGRCGAEAMKWCRATRDAAAEGFGDPLALAAASYGWEARAALNTEDYVSALNLYLVQHAAGDPSALESLRRVAAQVISSDSETLEQLARNRNARGVLTAYLISRGRAFFRDTHYEMQPMVEAASHWAAALARAGIRDEPRADRLAWTAYEGGLFSLAAEWAALAPEGSGLGQWILAQLALRAGNLREGETRLLAALTCIGELGLDEQQCGKAWGELMRTCLALDRGADALAAALEGGHWSDADYIANRVLSVDELRAFVDARPQAWAREWLALRLARNGQVDLAAEYFSERLRPVFREYVDNVRLGFDYAKPAATRAAAFWRAAELMHDHGLLGEVIQARYEPHPVEQRADAYVIAARRDARLTGGVFATTVEELARIEQLPALEKSFRHYRYRAAELAWWAASLSPNDSDETARILATAGGWLKARDPEAAKPFYQALVIRCGNTELGRAAAQAHWFPKPAGGVPAREL